MIKSLTKKQESKIPYYVDKWIAQASKPMNHDNAIKACKKLYKNMGEDLELVIFGFSPLNTAMLNALFNIIIKNDSKSTKSQIRSQIHSQIWSQLWSQLRSQLRSQIDSQLWSQLWSQLRSQLHSQIHSQIWSQLWSQLRSQLDSQIWSQLHSQLDSQFKNLNTRWYMCIYWLLWCGWYDYGKYIGIKFDEEKYNDFMNFTSEVNFIIPYKNIAFISEKPIQINWDNNNMLHNDSDLAVKYSDGYGMAMVHGVKVPDYVVLEPNKITAKDIEAEGNAEVRRVKIDKYGQSRYLIDSGAKEIHRDDWGVLYRKDVPDDEPIVMVKVVNTTPEPDGTFKDYFIRVPQETERAKQAVAWSFRKTEEEYLPEIQT